MRRAVALLLAVSFAVPPRAASAEAPRPIRHDPAVDGAVTGVFVTVETEMKGNRLWAWQAPMDWTQLVLGAPTIVNTNYTNGFSVDAMVRQGSQAYVAALSLPISVACPTADDPACLTTWHGNSGGYNAGGTGGALPFSTFQDPFFTGPPQAQYPDFSAAGAPLTFGISLGMTTNSSSYAAAHEALVRNVAIYVCTTRIAPCSPKRR